MAESKLIIQIVEARNLVRVQSAYAEVIYNKSDKQRTQPEENKDSIKWNEKFTFDVVNQNEEAVITIYNASDRSPIANCTYSLRDYPESELSDEVWLPLKTRSQNEVGQIKLIVQWIQSRTKNLKIELENLKTNLIEIENQLNFYKKELEVFHCNQHLTV